MENHASCRQNGDWISEGVLPGPLNLRRKASTYYIRASGYKASLQSRGLVFAYAGSK